MKSEVDISRVVETIYQGIKDKVNPFWTNLQKIRYIYLKTGEYLEKNTDFFLNEKMGANKLPEEENNKIFFDDKVFEVNRSDKVNYQTICKSSSIILKELYDRFDIESECVITCGKKDEVRHWFLVAKDGESQYFLTLAADFPYIKNHMPTKYFGNGISYFHGVNYMGSNGAKDKISAKVKSMGLDLDDLVYYQTGLNTYCFALKRDLRNFSFTEDLGYLKEFRELTNELDDPNNSFTLIFRQYNLPADVELEETTHNFGDFTIEHEEIKHTNLTRGNELQELDESIGYGSVYEYEDVTNSAVYNNLFYVYSAEDSDVFQLFHKCFGLTDEITCKPINMINRNSVNNFIHGLKEMLIKEISKVPYNRQNYETIISKYIQSKTGIKIEPNVTFKKYLRKVKKETKDNKIIDLIDTSLSILGIEDSYNNFLDIRDEKLKLEGEIKSDLKRYHSNDIVDKTKENEIYDKQINLLDVEKNLEEASRRVSFIKMNKQLHEIAYHFMKGEDYSKSDKYVPVDYIYKKFVTLFPLIFDCCYDEACDYQTEFSKQGYSEQVVIIKEMVKKMFSELTEKNCSSLPHYNTKFTPTQNRIRIYPLRSNKTGEYAIGFRFWSNPKYVDEDEINLAYIPSENVLRELTILDIVEYKIMSKSLDRVVAATEDLEDLRDLDEREFAL